MNIHFHVAICLAVLLIQLEVYGDGMTNNIDRTTLSSRTHATWEGSYTFSEDKVLSIEGLKDLHVLIYRCPGEEGTLVDFAELATDGKLRVLREAATNVKGVTPTLEGVDVLPDSNDTEIIVRWRHPGNGGLRTVEKYCYRTNGLEFVNRSEFVCQGRKMKWVSASSLERGVTAASNARPRRATSKNDK